MQNQNEETQNMNNASTSTCTPTIVIHVKPADFAVNPPPASVTYTIPAISVGQPGCVKLLSNTSIGVGTKSNLPLNFSIEVLDPTNTDVYTPVGISFTSPNLPPNLTLVDFPTASITRSGTLLKFTDMCFTPSASFTFVLVIQNSANQLAILDPNVIHDPAYGME
jgi:hypothetical protein